MSESKSTITVYHATPTLNPTPAISNLRIVENRCLCCTARTAREPARVLTIEWVETNAADNGAGTTTENGEPKSSETKRRHGFRISRGGHWTYQTVNDPAILTERDRSLLEESLADAIGDEGREQMRMRGYSPEFQSMMHACFAAAISALDAVPAPNDAILKLKSTRRLYRVQAYCDGVSVEPWSARMNRRRYNEGAWSSLWKPSEWLNP